MIKTSNNDETKKKFLRCDKCKQKAFSGIYYKHDGLDLCNECKTYAEGLEEGIKQGYTKAHKDKIKFLRKEEQRIRELCLADVGKIIDEWTYRWHYLLTNEEIQELKREIASLIVSKELM
jgi:hypothetical protein